jgi:hypothetical protein
LIWIKATIWPLPYSEIVNREGLNVTQHILAEDTEADAHTMKSLRNFILVFLGFSVALAIGVAVFAP